VRMEVAVQALELRINDPALELALARLEPRLKGLLLFGALYLHLFTPAPGEARTWPVPLPRRLEHRRRVGLAGRSRSPHAAAGVLVPHVRIVWNEAHRANISADCCDVGLRAGSATTTSTARRTDWGKEYAANWCVKDGCTVTNNNLTRHFLADALPLSAVTFFITCPKVVLRAAIWLRTVVRWGNLGRWWVFTLGFALNRARGHTRQLCTCSLRSNLRLICHRSSSQRSS
jgi:hypothetical protein